MSKTPESIRWFSEIDNQNITILKGQSPIENLYWKIKPIVNKQKIYWILISDEDLMEEWDEDLLFSDAKSAQDFCQRQHDLIYEAQASI